MTVITFQLYTLQNQLVDAETRALSCVHTKERLGNIIPNRYLLH